MDTNYLQEWLSKAPKYTTFRVNMLKDNIDLAVLKTFLVEVSKFITKIYNFSYLEQLYFP